MRLKSAHITNRDCNRRILNTRCRILEWLLACRACPCCSRCVCSAHAPAACPRVGVGGGRWWALGAGLRSRAERLGSGRGRAGPPRRCCTTRTACRRRRPPPLQAARVLFHEPSVVVLAALLVPQVPHLADLDLGVVWSRTSVAPCECHEPPPAALMASLGFPALCG